MPEGNRDTLLVEIGTEELPPKALKSLGAAFQEGVVHGLKSAGLEGDFEGSRWFATPRRLAVAVPRLQLAQADTETQKLGPSLDVAYDEDGKPTRAALGFARSVGADIGDLQEVDTPKGRKLAYRVMETGRPTAELVPGIVEQSLDRLPVPRRMRWGAGDFQFVRPVHWVVMLLGNELIEATLFGVRTGRQTHGHRFHHPDPVRLKSAADYEAALESARVIAGFATRRERIVEQVRAIASHMDGEAWLDDELLDEVTALTEWPVAVEGGFDESFLKLPPEVISTTLVHHQKFFPVLDGDGHPTTGFVAVANIESRKPDVVSQGYERVVRPRLADAVFFYQQDRATPLADRRGDLEGMLFHKSLGSIFHKTERMAALARDNATTLDLDQQTAERAAELAKCDLTTLMVGEFPELQGIMGGYYAEHDSEPEAVSRAIAEHYRPRFAGDEPPASAVGKVVALADKLDTLCGVLLAGDRPSGNKDPFALRRAALGVVRIIVEGGLGLDLRVLIDRACDAVAGQCSLAAGPGDRADVLAFFLDRLRGWYRERGVRADVLEAVLATESTRPLDLDRRIHAVTDFLALPEAASLAAANKRIRNILRQADGEVWDGRDWDADVLTEKEERGLSDAVRAKQRALEPLLESADYQGALRELAGLRDAVDSFFDHVMVMTDDDALRRQRLALLAGTNRMFSRIADISKLDVSAE